MNALKKSFTTVLGILLLSAPPSWAALNVVVTTPDLADIVRQIGQKYVNVTSLAKGKEDIHSVPQRPSFLPLLNRADAVVLIGLDLEHAFLPALLDVAQNPKILKGQPGYIDCSIHIKPMDVPTNLSRSEGELHPNGNPHYNMDPRQGSVIAETIVEGLSRIDPPQAAVYRQNGEAFKRALAVKMNEWDALKQHLACRTAISHHADMTYFADYMGITLASTVEPKPGIAPSAKRLEELAALMKEKQIQLLIHEIQYPVGTSDWLSHQTGAKVADVATMGGAFPDTQTYFGMIERNIRSVVEACRR